MEILTVWFPCVKKNRVGVPIPKADVSSFSKVILKVCRSFLFVHDALHPFIDGKFILELERARAGEKVSWVSVPRKTFWPPQGTAATPTYRPEGSTSLSGTLNFILKFKQISYYM